MYENGTTPQVFTNDNSAGWLLPWLLFGANGRGWGGYGQGNGNGCGCGPTLASELGKAENASVLASINALAATLAGDKSAAQTASVIAAVSGVENQITNLLHANALGDCQKQAELIRAIDKCCCDTRDAICGLNTTVLMGNQSILTQASTLAMTQQHAIDTGFCGVSHNIADARTDLSNQLCQMLNTLSNEIHRDGDQTRAILRDSEVRELRDKLAQCSNDAQTAKIEALILSSCGRSSHHGGCCTSNNGPGNS